MPRLWTLALSVIGACGGDPDPLADAGAALDAAAPDAEVARDAAPAFRPAAPARNDGRYDVQGIGHWSLIGNDLTPGDDTLAVSIGAPAGTTLIGLWLDEEPVRVLALQNGVFQTAVDISALAPGVHEVLLAADWAPTAFARLTFTRSHPLYCFVSTDWDDANNGDSSLDAQETLHALHPSLRLTHFAGPYTFTDPSLPAERVELLAAWLRRMRDDFDDEIGLHIHPRCTFVDTTAVPCRSAPSVASDSDPSGYTVVLGSYTEPEMEDLLGAADDLFEAHDLGKPTSFRAGAWTAEIHTLRALQTMGYVVDASAVAWQRLEEWEGFALFDWNRDHWAPIGDTSQPYHPSTDDILEQTPPQLELLEVPDNGALVDYVTGNEMIDVFEANWPGGALPEPRVYSIGYHPPNFGETYFTRMDVALANVDQYLAADDAGPVVYATGSELARVFVVPAP